MQTAYLEALGSPLEPTRLDALWAELLAAGQCDEEAGVCLVDGDLALTRAELEAEMRYRSNAVAAAKQKSTTSGELSLNYYKETADYWPRHLRKLTYFIDAESFKKSPDGEKAADIVRAALLRATADWEAACAVSICLLDFEETPDATAAVFHVRYRPDSNFGSYGYAPFPHALLTLDRDGLDPDRFTRKKPGQGAFIWVGQKFFATNSDPLLRREGYGEPWKLGDVRFEISQAFVMRHELGHLLGYRHEFVVGAPLGSAGFEDCASRANFELRDDAATGDESRLVDAEAGGAADIYSVMMTPCARRYADVARRQGENEYDFDIFLSTCDKSLHVALYSGAPIKKCKKT